MQSQLKESDKKELAALKVTYHESSRDVGMCSRFFSSKEVGHRIADELNKTLDRLRQEFGIDKNE